MGADILFSSDELDKILGDVSFSASRTDSDSDLSGWMRDIDVSNFQRLTSSSDLDAHLTQDSIIPVFNDVFLDNFLQNMNEEEVITSAPLSKRKRDSSSSIRGNRRKQNITNLIGSDDEEISLLSTHDCEGIGQSLKLLAPKPSEEVVCEQKFTKPVYSYSSLITLALKNCPTGRMHVADIYKFVCKTFPFYRTAPSGWKNSIRHNLSLNKCFKKIVIKGSTEGRQFCSWAINEEKIEKLETEIIRSREKNPSAARQAYANPADMEKIERGLQLIKPVARKKTPDICRKRGRPLEPKTGRTRPLLPIGAAIVRGKANVQLKKPKLISGEMKKELISRWIAQQPEAVNDSFNCEKIASNDDHDLSSSDDDADQPSASSFLHSPATPSKMSLRDNDSPPPNSFSTPVRKTYSKVEPRWSPAFGLFDGPRRQLWSLQNFRTPEKDSFSFTSQDDSFSDRSSIYGSPDKVGFYGKMANSRFATSFELAFRATSPLNNSLIAQTTDVYGHIEGDHQASTSFGNVE